MARQTPSRMGTSRFLTSLTPLVGYGTLCSISGVSSDHALPEMAGDFASAADLLQRRPLRAASRFGEPAPRVKPATRRRMPGTRNLTRHQQSMLAPLPGIRPRRKGEEA